MVKIICSHCDEEIKSEVTLLNVEGFSSKYDDIYFCDVDCLWEFVKENTTVEVIEDVENKWS